MDNFHEDKDEISMASNLNKKSSTSPDIFKKNCDEDAQDNKLPSDLNQGSFDIKNALNDLLKLIKTIVDGGASVLDFVGAVGEIVRLVRILESMDEDELKLLETKSSIHMNLQHLFAELDKDADNIIADCEKKKDQISGHPVCWLITQTILACGILFVVVVIPVALYDTGMLLPGIAVKVAAAIAFLAAGSLILYSILSELDKILKRRSKRRESSDIPNGLILYLKVRRKFPDLTPPVTSSSHPHLYRFLTKPIEECI